MNILKKKIMENKIQELISAYTIKKGDKMQGVTWYDVENYIMTPEQFKRFEEWMMGQTVGCVDDSCKTTYVYLGDLERFLHNEK